MKITADDFRKRYAEMSDEGLLALERNDLVAVAQECYDAEVARRGLKLPRSAFTESDEAAPDEQPGVEEPVAVGIYTYPDEAKMARSLLHDEQIPCYLENEHLLSIDWNLTNAMGGLRLMVPASLADRAREILEDMRAGESEISEPWDGKITHRFLETNGIRMHIAEAGSGPLVVLLHGFPESWNSWRHQLPALAAEGYHVVAPDLRGYGQTDRPEALEAYDIFQLTADT